MFINSLARGGAETQFLNVARALAADGHDVRIYVLLGLNDFQGRVNLPVHLLAPRIGPATVVNAVMALRRWRPDVVVSFLYQATLVGRLTALVSRVPVVISSMRNERLESRLRTRLYRSTTGLDTSTVTNSIRAAAVLEANRTVKAGRLTVIPNGLDLAAFECEATPLLRTELGLGKDVFLYLGVGRLVGQKDWSTLVSAVSLYTGPKAHWAIAGEGETRAELQALIDRLGVEDKVTLLGLRDDTADCLAASDALVLSSIYEGLPNVVLEAMAAGRPVVATRVGGTPELVTPDVGLLVNPSDSRALASAMSELAMTPAGVRRDMGDRARIRVRETYSLGAVESQWCELVRTLAHEASVTKKRSIR